MAASGMVIRAVVATAALHSAAVDTAEHRSPREMSAPAPPLPPQQPWQRPRIHGTPACFNAGGPHDVAGALYLGGVWHVMAGCWSLGGWQHMTSRDLVHWEEVGRPTAFGGSGELVHDAASGQVVAVANDLDAWTSPDQSNLTEWKSIGSLYHSPLGGQDPTAWYGADGKWYIATASKVGHGYEDMWSSASLAPGGWRRVGQLFEDTSSALVPGHPYSHEFVTPQYFGPIPGGAPDSRVFLTSTYGDIEHSGGVPRTGIYNFAMFYVGTALPNGSFAANRTLDTAVDWSCFVPSAATTGGIDLAWEHGGTQYGCCPKTAAGPGGRRVLFGWLQHGTSDGDMPGRGPNTDNAFTLPRDLTVGPGGEVLQRFVPELQGLRVGPANSTTKAGLSTVAAANAVELGIAGGQLELVAGITMASGAAGCDAGLTVLAGGTQFTAVGVNLSSGLAYIDRTRSGLPSDADVRAGPLAAAAASAAAEIQMHVYVDRSIVTVIVNNRTALTAWVHPDEGSLKVGAYGTCAAGSVSVTAAGYSLASVQ
mmetsp:Transcript_728/g.2362  ORF Transcript_728/g.2362 Transcript_728/m.2362 type:complete len:537 (+) Transcript_728:47-1657(+)